MSEEQTERLISYNEQNEEELSEIPETVPTEENNNDEGPTSPTPSNNDPDPLELRKLSLSYDYLMYKINDYINTLTEQTYQAIVSKQYQINQEYLNDQLKLFDNYDKIDELLKTVNNLEMEFLKLDQLDQFIFDFKQRLNILECEFDKL